MKHTILSDDKSEEQKGSYNLNLFDNLSETELNLIVKLASEICETKSSMVTLIDAKGQVFSSQHSEGLNNASNHFFFDHKDKSQDQLIFLNHALKGNSFNSNQPSKVSFIESVPLTTNAGLILGALCILDTEPRTLALHQKEALKSLARLASSLYESKQNTIEMDRIADQLNLKKEQTEKLFYTAAHDLKSPLDALRGLLELLHFKLSNSQSDEVQEYMNYALQSTKEMTEVIHDLLKFAKVQLIDEKDEIDIKELIQNVIDLNLPLIKSENIKVKVEHDQIEHLKTSKTLLSIVFRNLIGNALKYRSEKRQLHIKISVEDHIHLWLIKVEDNGIGIHKSNAEKIFKPFYRENMQYGEGVGMGLAMCKKIIENLGGDIWLDSELGKGSSFQFSIPK